MSHETPPAPTVPPARGWAWRPDPYPLPTERVLRFSARGAIGYGWRAFWKHAGSLLFAVLIAILVPTFVEAFLSPALRGTDSDWAWLAIGIPVMVLNVFLWGDVIRVCLDLVDGKRVTAGGVLSGVNYLQVLLAAIAVTAIVALAVVFSTLSIFFFVEAMRTLTDGWGLVEGSLGLLVAQIVVVVVCLVLLLPVLVAISLTAFTFHFVTGERQGAFVALMSSGRFVILNIDRLVPLAALSVACIVLGVLCLMVGVIIAQAMIAVASAYTFRALRGAPVRIL